VKKNIYFILALIGLLAPYYFLFKFLGTNGFDLDLLVQQLLANNISTFFAVDLVISIFVFWIYMFAESNKLQMKNAWLYLLASLLVGLSFALPLFLYFKERKLEMQ
jgi:antibiotic biosynthesis monooxygenase (ABM) superfamily enzyme